MGRWKSGTFWCRTTHLVPPCKDCPEREVGCHITCRRYKDFKAEQEKVRQKILKEKLYGIKD